MYPVETKLSEIAAALGENRTVVLTAPPGSGKTTRVAPALLDAPWLRGRKIVMLEPRRLAARNSARFMARERGERPGETIGYQVRLEREIGPATRLEVVTEGLLTERILHDPELKDTGLIIFDEFHERSLACDLAFALANEVRRAWRGDLRLMVMSATLDAEAVAAYFAAGEARPSAVVRAEGRMFPVATRYLGGVSVAAGVRRALAETDGDILCFLPGEGEIRRALERLKGEVGEAEVLPLYGALPKEAQDRVFRSSSRRKVILSTSVAETSVTVEGVTAVVDSGLMRVPRFSPATGMTALVTLPLTRDRAEQRRGRAGRVRPGICYRLWEEREDASHPAKAMPEILDADLTGLVLSSAAWGALRREDLPWITPPPAAAWERAAELLRMLGALDGDGRPTPKGVKMARLPMHPRLANMVLGGGDPLLAAVIEEGARSRETDVRRRYDHPSDFARELARRFQVRGVERRSMSEGAALALAYPERIARNRGNGTFQMVSARGAFLDRDDPLAKSAYLVCCELDDRPGDAKIFLAAPIAEDEIEALFGSQMEESPYCEWDRPNERVKFVTRRRLGGMTLDERAVTLVKGETGEHAELVAAALMDGVRQKGVANLPGWTRESERLRARIAFLHRVLGEGWPAASDAEILRVLPAFVGGMNKWRDLERVDHFRLLDALLAEAGHDRRELDRLAPPKMEVPTRSQVTIHYDGDEPTAEVRLQECFGLMTTPLVAGGTVPVVMTLLSPAGRPIQVTKDLAGFWRGAYQLVRKDMRGRYPKHYWPEDPLTAVATRRVRPDHHG